MKTCYVMIDNGVWLDGIVVEFYDNKCLVATLAGEFVTDRVSDKAGFLGNFQDFKRKYENDNRS
jgi:hypothetical protein